MAKGDLPDRIFWLANDREIKEAKTTDVYFLNTKEVLAKHHIDSEVVMEVFVRELPYPGIWGVLSGVYEAAKLLEGLPVDVWSFDEGSVFLADGRSVLYEPVMTIVGRYRDFAEYENPLLGLLASASSISTRAARFREAAGDRMLVSFGTRRVHPALAPLVERCCYISGFDGFSNVLAGKLLKVEPSGTMPHALVQVVGEQATAWRLYDKTLPKNVKRTVIADTFWDEKTEAVKALETLGKRLWAVRLDTPASRKGDLRKIIEEVRWELDIRGGESVKIIVSGRMDEQTVAQLKDVADGFGIGTAVAYPPVIDFSAKIVEVGKGSSRFRAKRGGLGGRKDVYRSDGFNDRVVLHDSKVKGGEPMLKPLLRRGKMVSRFEDVESLRKKVVAQLADLQGAEPSLRR